MKQGVSDSQTPGKIKASHMAVHFMQNIGPVTINGNIDRSG